MLDKIQIGTVTKTGESVLLDLIRILKGRMLIQANSGGGKSYAVRKICEVTHGKVQQIIIDAEGEFPSLREKFDYLLVGKDGDIPINLRATELLARKILELGVSVIIDIYELKHSERKRFVKNFFDALVNAPKEIWPVNLGHPCLIILDEGHGFAPESSHGQAESLESVKDMATRGRKRGFALIVATQRLSKLSKDVVAELNTKLIGRSSLDVDMKRAGFELGFTSKDDLFSLRGLKEGEFYAFGPALTNEVTKIKVGKCITSHAETGKMHKQVKIAPPAKIKRVLEKLSDLPKEAEEELRTQEDLKRRIKELKRETIQLKKVRSNPDDLKKHEQIGYQKGIKETKLQYEKTIRSYEQQLKQTQLTINKIGKHAVDATKIMQVILQAANRKPEEIKRPEMKVPPAVRPAPVISTSTLSKTTPSNNMENVVVDDIELSGPEKRILAAIACRPEGRGNRVMIALLARYSPKSSAFLNPLSHMRSMGLIEYQSKDIVITEKGRETAQDIEPFPQDNESVQRYWLEQSNLGNPEKRILRSIIDAYPNSISKEDNAQQAGYSPTSSAYLNPLSHMRSMGLIDYVNKEPIATKELFPEET